VNRICNRLDQHREGRRNRRLRLAPAIAAFGLSDGRANNRFQELIPDAFVADESVELKVAALFRFDRQAFRDTHTQLHEL
jgi:hypothetical protein